MPKLNKGDRVEQVLPAPVQGTVTGFEADQQTGDVLVRVEWTDTNGDGHARYFKRDDLRGVPAEV